MVEPMQLVKKQTAFVIPRSETTRNLLLGLSSSEKQIPRFARDDTKTRFSSHLLSQSAIEMHITAVDEYVLARNVASLRRNQKQNHRRNFLRLRHSFAERNLRDDVLQFF